MPTFRFFFGWEGEPPTKKDYRRKGTLVLTSKLEDRVFLLSLGAGKALLGCFFSKAVV